MSSEEELYKSPLLYRVLRKPEGALVLEVVVGGIFMSTVRVELDDAEASRYAQLGAQFADRMALQIMSEPTYGGRAYIVAGS